jgi:hypothetical protein
MRALSRSPTRPASLTIKIKWAGARTHVDGARSAPKSIWRVYNSSGKGKLCARRRRALQGARAARPHEAPRRRRVGWRRLARADTICKPKWMESLSARETHLAARGRARRADAVKQVVALSSQHRRLVAVLSAIHSPPPPPPSSSSSPSSPYYRSAPCQARRCMARFCCFHLLLLRFSFDSSRRLGRQSRSAAVPNQPTSHHHRLSMRALAQSRGAAAREQRRLRSHDRAARQLLCALLSMARSHADRGERWREGAAAIFVLRQRREPPVYKGDDFDTEGHEETRPPCVCDLCRSRGRMRTARAAARQTDRAVLSRSSQAPPRAARLGRGCKSGPAYKYEPQKERVAATSGLASRFRDKERDRARHMTIDKD